MEQHLSVQEKIKRVAAHFTACRYCYASYEQLNVMVKSINEDEPTICYILPPNGYLSVKHGGTTFVDKPTTIIAFLIQSEIDFDGEENDTRVEDMKTLARMFIQELNRSKYFDMVDDIDIEYRIPYDEFDDSLTGVIVSLPLEEMQYAHCEIEDKFGYVEDLNEDGEDSQPTE